MVNVNDFITNDEKHKNEKLDNVIEANNVVKNNIEDTNIEDTDIEDANIEDEQVDLYDDVCMRLAEATGKTLQCIWNYYVWYKLSELEEKGVSKEKLNEIESSALIDDKEIPFISFKCIWKKCIIKYKVIADNVDTIEGIVSLIPFAFLIHMKYIRLNKKIGEITDEEKI